MLPAMAPSTPGRWNGSLASGSAGAPRGAARRPRRPGRGRARGVLHVDRATGFSPEATFSSPSSVRTAHAQWRGPCTSTPLASAIPPRRTGSAIRLTVPGSCDVPEEPRAQLEVLDGDPLVRRVDEPRGQLGVHRPHGEEAVGDRAEGLAQEVAVGEARRDDRDDAGVRIGLGDEGLDRLPERRRERRAGAADGLDPLQVVGVLAERSADRRLDVRRASRPEGAGSRRRPRRGRDHVRALRGRDHRRRDREAEHRLDHLRARRGEAARRRLELGRSGTSPSRAKRASVSGMSRGGCAKPERARSAAPLARARCRRSPASRRGRCGRAPAGGTASSSSRRRAEVERPAAEVDALAAALVDAVVGAHASGCALQSQERPTSTPDLLVGGRREDEVAGGSKPSRASVAIAVAAAATWPFMSSAPRPQTQPSWSSPDHGSTDHSSGSATTVSVWERRSRLGPSPRPGIRATRFARSGSRA